MRCRGTTFYVKIKYFCGVDMNCFIDHLDGDHMAREKQSSGLDTLPQGLPAIVEGITPSGLKAEQALALRLMEIGFLPGEQVRVIAKGFPANDPLAVRVGQTTFALRRHEAALVQVHRMEQGGA